MSLVIPIGGSVNLLKGAGGGEWGVTKRESPDFRSPEVGISVYLAETLTT